MTDSDLGPEEYLLYEIIRQSNEVGEDILKTELHKLAYLTYKDVQEDCEGSVELPVYWFEHGIMVDYEDLSTGFFQYEDRHYGSTMGKAVTFASDLTPSDFDISSDAAEVVRDYARGYVERFAPKYGVSHVKDETYDRFGEDFVIALNNFRYQVEDLEGVDAVDADEYADTEVAFRDIVDTTEVAPSEEANSPDDVDDAALLEGLDSLIALYGDTPYSYMTDQFYEWESITRQLIYNGMYSQLGNFTSDFWNAFSRVELRIHFNENISPTKIHRWRQERDTFTSRFADDIDRFKSVVLDNREKTDLLGSVGEAYDEAVDDAYEDYRNQRH